MPGDWWVEYYERKGVGAQEIYKNHAHGQAIFQPSSLDILGGARTSAQLQGLYTYHTCAYVLKLKLSKQVGQMCTLHTHVRAKSYG